MSVNRVLLVFFSLAGLATLTNVALKIADVPDFMNGKTSQLFYSGTLNVTLSGDVFLIEDYHTINHRLFFNQKSHTSRVIENGQRGLYFSYFTDFYSDNLVQFTEFSLPIDAPMPANNVIQVEAHAMRRLNNEMLQIIHHNRKVLCYTKLLEGGVKCITRRK
ncbi:hypothetical protein OPW39_16870 [Vibrio europaeus]|uniref:hypothetical protein n=1 Tax=Vibrio oreintalis group TaxID=1891919 RepID=UPI001EFC42E0|nr:MULTISPECIES: hypothetical protein [Vibrio oreintalis group]MCG9578232.1 hypothetical protein [Vibrio tubiashii]MDC5870478.1 hypothetical protein [Vibrio europaeus]